MSKRTTAFRRNEDLESLLTELNFDLEPAEARLVDFERSDQPLPFPLVMVMGPLRSGTTLFMQWLANCGLCAYPTNLLSRFYRAPILGAKIQLLLTDPRFNFRDELGEFAQVTKYVSENGKTTGVLAPNEFWYFWRRFLAEPTRDVWTDDELRKTVNANLLRAELMGLMRIFQKPFAAKGMLFNYNVSFLDEIFDRLLIVQIKRDRVSNAASVLDARKRQLGSEEAWYSFEIPEFDMLKRLGAVEQAAGQVHFINAAVTRGLERLPEERKLVVNYEAFCDSPESVFVALCKKLQIPGMAYTGPQSFAATRTVSAERRAIISAAFERFA